ncbi:hypothetical protein [Pseudobutyrivibrio xylanivorans]|uniref:Uncharacterized protein n=1 Tax=Pseudobutyrivibrio xylanivorans TaxID=185007 RepID=A0A1G5S5I2_PSEXY|nr:hypothetical protein [Pseudobutyrivibrio xylanivorans]SCZ81448.1 hypothetical protein SAMN02910350_02826 [Pseudobutyrivibrio xylanivorans]
MKKIKVTRKKKFAGALMPYWIIVNERKSIFMNDYALNGDICDITSSGVPVARISVEELDCLGTRIMNGQTIEMELNDDISTMFISTMDGTLSNEINIDEFVAFEKPIVINTKGGFKNLSYPVIE